MTIKKEIVDEPIKDYKNPEDLLGENGLLKQLTKQLSERAMAAELTHQTRLLETRKYVCRASEPAERDDFQKGEIGARRISDRSSARPPRRV